MDNVDLMDNASVMQGGRQVRTARNALNACPDSLRRRMEIARVSYFSFLD